MYNFGEFRNRRLTRAVLRLTLLFFGMTMIKCGMVDSVLSDEEQCRQSIQNETENVKNWNAGLFDPPDKLPAVLYGDDTECWTGEIVPTEAEADKSTTAFVSWIQQACEPNYKIPEHDSAAINKGLIQKGVGKRCKSGTCRWDTKRRDTLCAPTITTSTSPQSTIKHDPPDLRNGNQNTSESNSATAISDATRSLLIPVLMLVTQYGRL